MTKEKIIQYPLKQKKSLMDKAKNDADKQEISFNQWMRNAMKKQLKIK